MEKIWLKNYPKDIPHEIPTITKSLNSQALDAFEKFKDKAAFISLGKKLSYKQCRELSFQLGAYLQSTGLKKGDKIALQLPNLLQYPVSLWASLFSGYTIVNINPLYKATEMLHQLKDADVQAIILLSNSAKALESILPKLNFKTIIITEPGDLLSTPKRQIVNFIFKYIKKKSPAYNIPQHISFRKALKKGASKKIEIIERDLDDTIFIQYTGGTTGVSKGACLTQRNILSNTLQAEYWLKASFKSKTGMALAPLPFYHIFSFVINGLLFFKNGITNVLITDPRNLQTVIASFRKYPIVIGTGVNTLFKALAQAKDFQKLDFSSLEFFISGGMALESDTAKQWKSVTKTSLMAGYGLTEASPVVCCNLSINPRPDSIGLPLPSTQVRVVDDQGQVLGCDKDGELEVFGPQVMKGYYQKEEETRQVLAPDGWLKTGDIAYIDTDGFVFIRDRKKDMINISGLKVYPNEVENILTMHPKIKESAVIGIKDERSSEAVKAFVVVMEGEQLSREEVISHCREHLAKYKIPKQIEFTNSIPKTNLGKNLRRVLK